MLVRDLILCASSNIILVHFTRCKILSYKEAPSVSTFSSSEESCISSSEEESEESEESDSVDEVVELFLVVLFRLVFFFVDFFFFAEFFFLDLFVFIFLVFDAFFLEEFPWLPGLVTICISTTCPARRRLRLTLPSLLVFVVEEVVVVLLLLLVFVLKFEKIDVKMKKSKFYNNKRKVW